MTKNQQPVSTQNKPEIAAINAKRRRAMVWYLLSLFLVAALLVTVSLVVQNRNLKLRDNEQSISSRTLQGRIEALQEEERGLRVALAEHLIEDAKLAQEQEDTERFLQVMAELEPYADVLTGESKTLYQNLIRQLPPEGQ